MVERRAPAVVVRRLEPTDDPVRLGALVVGAYRSLPGYVSEPEYEVELRDVAGRSAVAEIGVAVVGGEPVGCVTFVPGVDSPLAEFTETDAAGMRMLAVDASARGAGIGASLVAWCVERARAHDRRLLLLHSAHYMTAAHRLYARLGFQRAPERDWFPFPGLLLYAYELNLG